MSYNRGDFSFVKSFEEQKMLEDAFQAMERVEGSWNYISNPEFSFRYIDSDDNMIEKIFNEVDKMNIVGHSGFSHSWTMKQIEYIAKHSWKEYVDLRLENYRKKHSVPRLFSDPFFEAARTHPVFNKQIEAAETMAAQNGGVLSYAQMREFMG